MSHRVVEKPWEIKKGTFIEFRPGQWFDSEDGPTEWGETVVSEFMGRECGCLKVRVREGHNETRMIPEDWYTASLLISPDLRLACTVYRKKLTEQGMGLQERESHMRQFMTAWTLCEKMYGIDSEGSKPTDRRREVAFAILKGDPMALDMASDILGQ